MKVADWVDSTDRITEIIGSILFLFVCSELPSRDETSRIRFVDYLRLSGMLGKEIGGD